MSTPITAAVDDDATPRKSQTLPQLRAFEGTLYVKNNTMKFYAIRTMLGQQRIDVELQPVGQPDSIAILPKACLELRGFQRAWLRGELTVSSDPEIEDEITLLMNQHVKASDEQLAQFQSAATPSNISRDLVSLACLQCGRVNKEGVIEVGRVLQSAADVKNGIPPLCPDHSSLAHLFVPTQYKDEQGEDRWRFDPVTTPKGTL